MTNLFSYILSIFAFLHPQDKEITMKFPENIKNIGIVHNREYERGTLRIELHDQEGLDKAGKVLENNGYNIYL